MARSVLTIAVPFARVLAASVLLAATAAPARGQFSRGHVVVSSITLQAPARDASPVTLTEFTPAGAATGFTVTLPTAAPGQSPPPGTPLALTESGSVVSSGYFNLQADGRGLVVGGYNAPLLAGRPGPAAPRRRSTAPSGWCPRAGPWTRPTGSTPAAIRMILRGFGWIPGPVRIPLRPREPAAVRRPAFYRTHRPIRDVRHRSRSRAPGPPWSTISFSGQSFAPCPAPSPGSPGGPGRRGPAPGGGVYYDRRGARRQRLPGQQRDPGRDCYRGRPGGVELARPEHVREHRSPPRSTPCIRSTRRPGPSRWPSPSPGSPGWSISGASRSTRPTPCSPSGMAGPGSTCSTGSTPRPGRRRSSGRWRRSTGSSAGVLPRGDAVRLGHRQGAIDDQPGHGRRDGREPGGQRAADTDPGVRLATGNLFGAETAASNSLYAINPGTGVPSRSAGAGSTTSGGWRSPG